MSHLDRAEDLLRAFSARDLDAIRDLADAGVEIDALGGGALTVLMRAVLRGDGVAAEWILAAGADPDARGHGGETALDLAHRLGRRDLIDLLIAAGATPREPPAKETATPAQPPRALPVLVRPRDAEAGFADSFDDRFDDRVR